MSERSPIEFPPELPITAKVADIATAIDGHPVVIVAGATGSGKTTQLPKIALAMGRGLEKIIGVTQPRRIAATSVAARVAAELGTPLGSDVGYQIRFDDRTSAATYVKFMTDGILLAEIHGDPLLRRYDTLVIDEAHERSLTIDFLLGWVKRILPERPDLKVVVSSATLETERFSAFFDGAPVVEVAGRTFPVEVLHEPPPDDADMAEAVANAVSEMTSLDPRGDVLVFLPGEREIREAESELKARNLRHTLIAPLYGRLAAADQNKVFAQTSERRVILATNVAETSVTIPGIVYVVDTGLARLSRYDPRSGTTRLQIEGISQASAEQRKGRCGRVRDGICIRLYDEASYAARPAFTDPEIKRTGLAGVILRMKALGLGDVEEFPFLDPPNGKAVAEGYRVLEELGALDAARELTPLGERLARFPVDPRLGRMILAGADLGCLREVLVVVAALSIQDPRERPREVAQRADDAHRRFKDERSDFVTLLRIWDVVRDADRKSRGQLRRLCKESFLSFIRVREWFEVHRQLEDTVRELRLPAPKPAKEPDSDALHRALLAGLLSKVGLWNAEHRIYVGAKQTRFAIHPSSGLARKPPAWVMAFELVETTQLFARMVAKIEPEQLLEMGGHLLKRSYSDPHWSEKSARASVKEHATLFGLSVARDRSVDYASVAPAAARRIFLDHALVRGEYTSRGAFQKKNRELLDEAARLRAKARRSDMFADEDALIAFFEARVPDDVVNGKTFEAWRERAEREDPARLLLSLEDVFVGEPGLSPAAYPDEIAIAGTKVPVAYVFDPSAEDDGITLSVPLILLPQLEPGTLDWTIPGWHATKIAALLDELPRGARRDLGDLRLLAGAIAPGLAPAAFSGPLVPAVVAAVAKETGVSVPEEAFRPDAIAAYFRATIRVVDVDGKVVAQSRDADDLLRRFGAKARAVLTASVPASKWEREGLTSWSFGELPPFVVRKVREHEVRAYPAIVDRGSSVALELLETEAAAARATRGGVQRLLTLAARPILSAITPRLPRPLPRLDGALVAPSKTELDAFRAALTDRIVVAAFRLDDPEAPLPRSAAELDALVASGKGRLDPAARVFSDALAPIATELDKLLAGLKSAGKQPSGRLALLDIQAQLGELFPPDFIRTVPFARLEHVPRYLRAAQARLQRAIADPRKDADKHAPLGPLWKTFLAKRASFRDAAAADEVRWSFEELRVAVFAPELRTPAPVSVAKVAAALAALR